MAFDKTRKADVLRKEKRMVSMAPVDRASLSEMQALRDDIAETNRLLGEINDKLANGISVHILSGGGLI